MKNIQNLIRPSIKALKPYSSARDEFKGEKSTMIFLDANENPFDNSINRYPDPQQLELKTAISKLKHIPSDNILLGNGSDEVLDLLIRVFCEPNTDNILILPPTYGMYEVLANVNAVETIKVELSTSNFEPQIKHILKAANSNSKILFLCSPNNPTGNSFDTATVEELLKEFKGIVVIDEAYIDFSKSESWLQRLDEFPNLVITQTLSKAYGMAGIRLGICYASTEIISVLNKIKPPYNVNTLTQQKALQNLNKEVVASQIKMIIEERKDLISSLKTLKFAKYVYPSDANFLLVKVDDANRRYAQLAEKGIIVRNRTNQPLCENCLRLTVGTPAENKVLIRALEAL